MRSILLRIDPTASEASWQRIENGRLAGSFHQGRLSDAKRYTYGAHVIVLVSSEDVFMTRLALPGKNRNKLLKAVPFAVEDQIVDDIDNLHFALSPQPDQDKYIVAAVEQRLMNYWDSALKAAGIQANAIVPDVLALLDTEDSWTVLLEPSRAIVRSSHGLFSSDIENLPFMLNNMHAEAGDNPPAEVTVYDCSEASYMTSLQALSPNIPFNVVECTEGPLGVFAKYYEPRRSVNLLQGEFHYKQGMSRHFKPWIPAAALFVIWIGWQLILNIFALVDLNSQSEALTTQMQQVHKSAFASAKVPIAGYERSDMEARLKKLLEKQGQASNSLQEMLVTTAPIIKNLKGVTVNGIRYNNGKLDLELTVQQASEVDPLKSKIESKTGWAVKSQASTVKGVTKVRLNMQSSS